MKKLSVLLVAVAAVFAGSFQKASAQDGDCGVYASYYQGAREIGVKVLNSIPQLRSTRGEEWLYLEAEWRLYTSSVRKMQLMMDGTEIRFRNHQRDKKGKLISVEAYFVQRREVISEIK